MPAPDQTLTSAAPPAPAVRAAQKLPPESLQDAPPDLAAVVAVLAGNVLDAVDLARDSSPAAELVSPQGSSWSAEELATLASLARSPDQRDLIVCGLEWLRPELTPRLLKPLEEHSRLGRWLLPVGDWARLPAPLAGRVTATLDSRAPLTRQTRPSEAKDGGGLLGGLWRRRDQLSDAELKALERLLAILEPDSPLQQPARLAHQAAEDIARLATHPLLKQAGGRAALCDAMLGSVEGRLQRALAGAPETFQAVQNAAGHIHAAREALVWNTATWPLLTLALTSSAAALDPTQKDRPRSPDELLRADG